MANMSSTSGTPVPFDDAVRRKVLAEIAARPRPASLRPLSLTCSIPLRPLSPTAAAKVDARRRAGLEPAGADHPRRERWQWTVVPVVTGSAGAVVLIVAELISHHALALVAALVLAASVVAGVAMSAWVMTDPLRVRHDERRTITNARYWESRQSWSGPVHDAPERALVSLAADLIVQIAASPAWNSSYLEGHRSRFDLTAELDQIDAQAQQCAMTRVARPADTGTEVAYFDLVDRVGALRGYAQALESLGTQLSAAAAGVDAELRGGAFADPSSPADYATDGLRRLTSELTYMNSSLANQIATTRPRPGLTGEEQP